MLRSLIHNAALLLAVTVAFDLVTSERAARDGIGPRALSGLALGALCVLVMIAAMPVTGGVRFDALAVLLSVSGLFVGSMPTLIAMAIAATYRVSLGAAGVEMDLLVIASSGGIGILWRRNRRRRLQWDRRHAAELEERVQRRTAQLESANQELEAFSHSVSHDLRAPLRHLTGYVDLLTTRHREHLPEAARHYLDQVGDSATHMGALINALLAFARTGRQDLTLTEVDMNAAVEDARGRLGAEVKDRTIAWRVADLPRVSGDYTLIRQVWVNLLANAIKYTRRTAKAEIEVGATRGPGHWEFFVRDNGVGYDMRYASKLFGVFQRLHAQEDFEGIGIGLANVRRIIHKHGGEIQAEGRLNEGATFRFTIPDNPRDEGVMS